MKPLCSHLLGAGYWSRFLSLRFFCSLCTFCYSVPCYSNHLCRCATLHKSGLEFSFSTVAAYTGGGLLLVVFIVFIITFVLNCDAKVQRYLQPTKHFAKKVCIFNLLQQIKLFLPKFIHILSTKLAKCAIYKAKMFAFAEYPHTNAHVHYIKTNNRLPLYSCCSVLL